MIPFTKPFLTGHERDYLLQALEGELVGGGSFTHRAQSWLEAYTQTSKVLLTHSCTGALEMSALLCDLKPDDEVIMPSYTFVSTANAFVLRGAVPVFVDIRPDTLNIDETLIEPAITPRTKAIVPVHYAGVPCAMDEIMALAHKHHLWVIEDAAQGLGSFYKGRALGTIGHSGAYSFHATKNIIAGEGGCLLVNEPRWVQPAEILWEKGTDRSRFLRGAVDKYTWQSVGSSFLPSELTAAFLLAQLEHRELIQQKRLHVWNTYHERLAWLEQKGYVQRPSCPQDCLHNGHIYYLILPQQEQSTALRAHLKAHDIQSTQHYVPLHLSPMGGQFHKTSSPDLSVTESIGERLIRLPLGAGLSMPEIEKVVETVETFFEPSKP